MSNSKKRFSIHALSAEGVDPQAWAALNIQAVPDKYRERVERRLKALQAYLTQRATVEDIKAHYGVASSSLFKMLEKALAIDSNGELVGYRAALLNVRASAYKRVAPAAMRGPGEATTGDAGIFSQLLQIYPKLRVIIRNWAKRYKPRGGGGVKRIVDYHEIFLKECRKLGIQSSEYPFSRKDRALRSFERHLKIFASEIAIAKRDQLAENLKGQESPKVSEPLQEVQIDGHSLDVRLTVQDVDQYGLAFCYEILTVWIILVIDAYTRCVLGYSIALGKNYDQTDLLKGIFRSIAPHEPPRPVISGITYKPQGGFPSEKMTGLAWSTGLVYKMDNALSHHATDVQLKLQDLLGCTMDYGPPHRPNDRAIVESYFNFLVDNFSHRVVGSTGAHPRDEIIKRLAPRDGNLSLLLTLEEMQYALDVVISDYNGRPHSSIAPHSPLELFILTAQQKKTYFPRLAKRFHNIQWFTNKSDLAKVRSDGALSAYINFKQVRYRNLPTLKNSVGEEVVIEWDPYDLSYLKIYDRSGDYLGQIFPPSPWTTPHSEKLRARLMSAVKQGQIAYRSDSIADMLHDLQTSKGWGQREITTYNLKHTGAATLPVAPPAPPQSPQVPVERLRRSYITRSGDDD